MQNRFQNIIIWVWLIHLLVTTTGFSINVLYCYCKGSVSYSLIDETHNCSNQHAGRSPFACCLAKHKKHCEKIPSPAPPCTQKTTSYIKLSAAFLVNEFKPLPQQPMPVILPGTFVFQLPIQQPSVFISPENKAPPPHYGAQFLPFVQSFLC